MDVLLKYLPLLSPTSIRLTLLFQLSCYSSDLAMCNMLYSSATMTTVERQAYFKEKREEMRQMMKKKKAALNKVCFSPLETISTFSWASLHHHFPVVSVFCHVSCHLIFFHILPGVVEPSLSRPPPSSLPRYN